MEGGHVPLARVQGDAASIHQVVKREVVVISGYHFVLNVSKRRGRKSRAVELFRRYLVDRFICVPTLSYSIFIPGYSRLEFVLLISIWYAHNQCSQSVS